MTQLTLFSETNQKLFSELPYRERLFLLLQEELDFHGQKSNYSSHTFHAFPAKFPPQLPAIFINNLTDPGDLILDPMAGSGTTILEANLLDRLAIGCDIDPLAAIICKTKLNPSKVEEIDKLGHQTVVQAEALCRNKRQELQDIFNSRFDNETQKFIKYWFAQETIFELLALIIEIEKIQDISIRSFLTTVFSAIIITKSGGVSLALDLAHTRPHRDANKEPRSSFSEFKKRLKLNLQGLFTQNDKKNFLVCGGNAQLLPLSDQSVDLIVTSPPYASNAIDYMRANKFSLVWLGYPIDRLGKLRSQYIGSESLQGIAFEEIPSYTANILQRLDELDHKKSLVIHRYFSEMKHMLQEMYRVLRPGKAAIIVVGTSIIRGMDVETQNCLGDIGRSLGFDLIGIGVRALDRDKRMMPARRNQNNRTQIEERMHNEYILGFIKP